MRAYPWEAIQSLISGLEETQIGAGLTVDILSPNIYLVSASWLEFLNSDPTNGRTMWLLYREFASYVQEFQAWSTEKGYCYDGETRSLSREEFLEQYHSKWQADSEKLHMGMKRAIDKSEVDVIKDVLQYPDREKHSRAKERLTGGASIPALFFRIRVTNLCEKPMTVRMLDPCQMQIGIPEVNHLDLWLHAILGGMVSSYRDGRIPRRCLACPKYFIPYSRAQKFHNPTCRSRYNMQRLRRRKA